MAKVKEILEADTLATPVPGMPGCYSLARPVLLTHFAGASSEKWTASMVGVSGMYTGKVYIAELGEWRDADDFDINKG